MAIEQNRLQSRAVGPISELGGGHGEGLEMLDFQAHTT